MNEIWAEGKRGRLFLPGKEAPEIAAAEAERCVNFNMDYEEECLYFPDIICYNCRYRRWTADSFECLKK